MSTTIDDPLSPSLPERRRSDATGRHGEDGGDTCRICRSEGTPGQPLFYPCKCSGSIKFVHQECLMEWLSHSQKKYCELCKTPFRFTKLYHQSMPEQVPFLLFLRKASLQTLKALSRWCRYVLVIFVWLCWLPWTIRQIWRGLFWIADGSWLSNYEMRAALEAYSARSGSDNSTELLQDIVANITLTRSPKAESLAFVSSLAGLLSLLDLTTAVRWTLRALLNIILSSSTLGKWGHGFFSFTPFPRPPSLLSDVQTLHSATSSPLFNNAIIDVLEGQLICLTIVAAFILVFLIREWVINQQPLAHIPEAEQPNDAPPAPQQPEPNARHRPRGLHRPREPNALNANRPAALGNRPRAQPRARRTATENNILVANRPAMDTDRPAIPPRAASLIPALQEMEDNIRQLQDPQTPSTQSLPTPSSDQVRAPPLQRGQFDEVGQIRRSIEERSSPVRESQPEEDSPRNTGEDDLRNEVSDLQTSPKPLTKPFTFGTSPDASSEDERAEPSTFTFRIDNKFPPVDTSRKDIHDSTDKVNDEDNWSSDSEPELVHTPETSDASQQAEISVAQNETNAMVEENGDLRIYESSDNDSSAEPVPANHRDTLWMKLTDWLWQTDDFVPIQSATPDSNDSEVVDNIDEQPPFVPVNNNQAGNEVLDLPDVAAAPQEPQPNVQDGVNINDPNAIDDAEDLEGILELIGMEGPIAGMIQNIIFSVFLISLTLSASVWCPYIWGKIALLLIAHPLSVFVKAPLFLVSRAADLIVDVFLFLIGWIGVTLNNVTKIAKILTMPLVPSFSKYLNVHLLDDYFYSLSSKSGSRLEKVVAGTFWSLRPDLPTFSMQSHHVLRVFTTTSANLIMKFSETWLQQKSVIAESMTWRGLYQMPLTLGSLARSIPVNAQNWFTTSRMWHAQLQDDLRPISFANSNEIDYSLVSWSSREKIVCVVLGYILFALAGYIYLQITHLILGLKKDEKVPGVFADTLRQAGGVLKVIVIIGIEMIVFPLYCGIMLDTALLPLFEGATLQSRFTFFVNAPITALFVHWFLGTCYMFHFALFVSMCRKLLRKGVLYFIRDPDDPTFHPVRDVLERPVATQLGKIAFSALVYGSLLIFCLGGVVMGLSRAGSVLPIHWSAREPLMKIPGDIVFYNFMLPFILRKIDLSDKVSALFEWWFRACAAGLRLTDFLFGIDSEHEKQPGIFLWKHFFDKLKAPDIKSPPTIPIKNNVKYFERLAKHPERLFWFEHLRGKADKEAVRDVFGSDFKFSLINLTEKDSQVLLKFDKRTDLKLVEQVIDRESKNEDARYKIRQVKDVNIHVLFLRNTPVHPSAGMYVRAPAKDSVRIPKGTSVFLQVDEKDNTAGDSKDVKDDQDDRFTKIFIPTHFKARITTFIALVWLFAAFLGLVFTLGPLLIGRFVIRGVTGLTGPVNDLYAVTIGMHALGAVIYILYKIMSRYHFAMRKLRSLFTNTRQALPHVLSAIQQLLGITYLSVALGIVLPMALSILSELYIHVPIYTYVVSNQNDTTSNQEPPSQQATSSRSELPIIHLLQTWTLGILYLRIVIRILTTMPHTNTQAATAVRAIVRNGYTRPDVRLASRALILPILTICIVLLALPLFTAQIFIRLSPHDLTEQQKSTIYQYSYPTLLFTAAVAFISYRMKTRIAAWRTKIRDEVYLIGERLHNFPSQDRETNKVNKKPTTSKQQRSPTGKEDTSSTKSSKAKGKERESTADVSEETQTPATRTTNHAVGSAESSDEEDIPDLEEALRRSSADLLAFNDDDNTESQQGQSPQASASRVVEDGERRAKESAVVAEIEDFKDVTGLKGLANAEELGDMTLAVVAAHREEQGGAN